MFVGICWNEEKSWPSFTELRSSDTSLVEWSVVLFFESVIMNNTRAKLAEYCQAESYSITERLGLGRVRLTNDNYIKIRNLMHHHLPQDEVASAVFNLTTLLAFVSLIGYPDE